MSLRFLNKEREIGNAGYSLGWPLALTGLVCLIGLPLAAHAQTSGTFQQLPSAAAQQQVPPSFPDQGQPQSSASSSSPTTGNSGSVALPVRSGGTSQSGYHAPVPSANRAGSGASVPFANQSGSGGGTPSNSSSGSGGSSSGAAGKNANVTSSNGPLPKDAAAADKAAQVGSGDTGQSATNAPTEPAQKKLVPATPMGSAAQGAKTGRAGQMSATGDDQGTGQADADTTQAGDDSPGAAMPDLLQKYAAKNKAVAAQQGAPESDSGDALPKVAKPPETSLTLQTNFENSNRNVTVQANGQPDMNSEEMKAEIRSEAFDAAMTGMFPLSPDQIKKLLGRYDTTQRAVKLPYAPPKPQIIVQNISLDPGIIPPTIKTATGNVTTINILDATGAPWPVQDVTWAGDFEIVEPEEGGHIIRITPMSEFAHGNIVIRLLTLKTPISLTLETGRDTVQYRVDARIPEYGPFASAPLMSGGKSQMIAAGNSDLTSILDGVMPDGMQKLQVVGVDGRTSAYSLNGLTYVRTPLTLLSPAWQSSVSSADGMNVYALTNAPVLLLSDGGQFIQATLKEKQDLLDE